jgi:hypothetical protein
MRGLFAVWGVALSFAGAVGRGAVVVLGVVFLAGLGVGLLAGAAVMASRVWVLVRLLVAGVRVRATVVDCWHADDHDTTTPEYWVTVDYDTGSGEPERDVRLALPLPFRPPDGSLITVRRHRRGTRQAAPVDVRILGRAVVLMPLCLVSGAGFLALAASRALGEW